MDGRVYSSGCRRLIYMKPRQPSWSRQTCRACIRETSIFNLIDTHRHTLTICGTRAATLPTREKAAQLRVFCAERLSGAFSRSIRLPEPVDADKVTAAFAEGVLTVTVTVTVPKSRQLMPRRISINGGLGQTLIDR